MSTESGETEAVTWQSYSLGDAESHGSEQVWPILKEGERIGTYTRNADGDRLDTAYGEWVVDASADRRISATLSDGRVFSTTASDRDKISRAKELSVDFGGAAAAGKLVCEGSTNYVIEDARTGQKWGQFTGASRGVRHAEVQFDTDEGRALGEAEKIFLVYSARRVLESRMVSTSLVLSVCLLLLVAYTIWLWIV